MSGERYNDIEGTQNPKPEPRYSDTEADTLHAPVTPPAYEKTVSSLSSHSVVPCQSCYQRVRSKWSLRRWLIPAAFVLVFFAGSFLGPPHFHRHRSMDHKESPPPAYKVTGKPTPQSSPPLSEPLHPLSTTRSTVIETTSNSIKGSYQLYDLLSLKSTSGSIGVTVTPEAAAEKDPSHPARFIAETKSGSVRADFRTFDFPSRDYRNYVGVYSGSIHGTYPLGTSNIFKTQSGSITISLVAVNASAPVVSTTTASGSQTITIVDSTDDCLLKDLQLECVSVSGTLTIRAPAGFEGTIRASSTSGSIKVGGSGVKVVKDVHAPGSRYVEAMKGSGSGNIVLRTTNASVNLQIG